MSGYSSLAGWIREENSHMPSCEDQITTARWFLEHNFTENDDDGDVRTSTVRENIGHRLDHEVPGVLGNLEQVGVLTEISLPGSGGCIRHHRTNEAFFSPSEEKYVPYLNEEVSRFLDDMHSQVNPQPLAAADGGNDEPSKSAKTLRSVALEALDEDVSSIEDELTEPGDPFERMLSYDDVIKAIKKSEEVSIEGDYDEMGWRNFATKWTLSRRATRMGRNESLTSD